MAHLTHYRSLRDESLQAITCTGTDNQPSDEQEKMCTQIWVTTKFIGKLTEFNGEQKFA